MSSMNVSDMKVREISKLDYSMNPTDIINGTTTISSISAVQCIRIINGSVVTYKLTKDATDVDVQANASSSVASPLLELKKAQ